ncbi:putative C6 transcription factor [Aspergillus homomorphus CBS 101889]|uniref:Uncharacterized protein n=1 Tax=Aspergillus homomorphus (strain CBS 101889) TaxID=1450537 RepID=A0A395HVT7_ASPHC|nr:hypothetical protein BO97DRAFT_425299 [Aspergillus homomorphus CBS 101889]RAL11636.1 hypothetical protein BO97DRAFT_425299 [Aspergillus homomorphus CBS 101889]
MDMSYDPQATPQSKVLETFDMSPESEMAAEFEMAAESEIDQEMEVCLELEMTPEFEERIPIVESFPDIEGLPELEHSPDTERAPEFSALDSEIEEPEDEMDAMPSYQTTTGIECGLDGNPDFCTPLLVNSILAVAATYSDYPELRAVRGMDRTRGQDFFEEAERLWKAEEGRSTLADISSSDPDDLKFQGKRQASWLMLRQAVQLAKDIGLLHSTGRFWNPDMPVRNRHAEMSFERSRSAYLEPPCWNPDKVHDFNDRILWSAYPSFKQDDLQETPAQLGATLDNTILLAKIAVRIQEFLFNESWRMPTSEVEATADVLLGQVRLIMESLPDSESDQQELSHILLVHGIFQVPLGPQQLEATPEKLWSCRLEPIKKIVEYLRVFESRFGLRSNSETDVGARSPQSSCSISLQQPRRVVGANDRALSIPGGVQQEVGFGGAYVSPFRTADQSSNLELPPEALAVLKGSDNDGSQWM